MSWLHWWADRVGKGNLVKANADYGIAPRNHVVDGTKRRDLDDAKLALGKDEPKYRLETEWQEGCAKGSVLYFCTHGAPDQVWLGDEVAVLLTMKEWVDCDGCHVHFGGCDTFSGGEENLRDFMNYTNAASVSGHAREVGWVDWTAPAITLEVQFFAQLSGVNIVNQTKKRAGQLRRVEKAVSKRFPDCEFNMLVRP